jgi:hypothetical protein
LKNGLILIKSTKKYNFAAKVDAVARNNNINVQYEIIRTLFKKTMKDKTDQFLSVEVQHMI